MNKRILSLILAAVLLFSSYAFSVSAINDVASDRIGDVDGDGAVLPRDAAIVARYLAGWEDYVDENGGITFPNVTVSGGFSVGYAILDITPDLSYYKRMPLSGYGATHNRIATGVPDGDGISLTCVAIRDEEGGMLLLYSFDIIGFGVSYSDSIRAAAQKAVNVPAENVLVARTHSHTSVDSSSTNAKVLGFTARYRLELLEKSAFAARQAVNNLGAATMFAGDTCTTDINFVRRYFTTYQLSGTSYQQYQTHYLIHDEKLTGYEGPNNVDDGEKKIAHETEGDNEVQYLLFSREGQNDVILYNWQCHPDQIGNNVAGVNEDGSFVSSYQSSGTNRLISADYVNGARKVLSEAGYDSLYFQGGAGNMNQTDSSYSTARWISQLQSAEYRKYRITRDEYYTNISSAGKYFASQMRGAILADCILKDMKLNYDSTETVHPTWTDHWVGLKPLETGPVRSAITTYYTTRANNDADIGVVMKQLAGIADGSIRFLDSDGNETEGYAIYYKCSYPNKDSVPSLFTTYSGTTTKRTVITYNSSGAVQSDNTTTTHDQDVRTSDYVYIGHYSGVSVSVDKGSIRTNTTTTTKTDYTTAGYENALTEIRQLASDYAALSDQYSGEELIARQKTFAWNVLDVYRLKVYNAFQAGLSANNGSSGGTNAVFKAARLIARLATGLYHNNYYAGQIGTRNSYTDLTHLETDPSQYVDSVRLEAFSIGTSVGFAIAPYEMFDTVGQMIKDGKYIVYDANGVAVTQTAHATLTGYTDITYQAATYSYGNEQSPFDLTFICAYSNGSYGYMPTVFARTHVESNNRQNGYETYVTHYALGTAEGHAIALIRMLERLYEGDDSPAVAGPGTENNYDYFYRPAEN